jgi:hypothetical protein
VWLCVLLAALFLYNPFLTAPSSALGLHVRHSASHRATVGSSELQQFRASERLAPSVPVEELVSDIFVMNIVVEGFAPPEMEVPSPQNDWPASLWFRPPPAR